MSLDPVTAASRFGYGPSTAAWPFAGDPRAAMLDELRGPDLPALPRAALATGADGLAAIAALNRARRAGAGDRAADADAGVVGARQAIRSIAAADRTDTIGRALAAPFGFRERLVAFWADHFTVSTRQGGTAALAGSFRREAIAPHANGRFVDMLLAVMRHPAMLRYLENDGSVGPDSPVGLRTGRGLNENLARECLELHTVGRRSGYTQTDVTAFAAILTGWSVQTHTPPYGFAFRPRAHQPGAQTVMGTVFPPGEGGGDAALRFLGTHPATYRNLATKLARHFVADSPPPSDVDRIAAVLADTGGHLGAASEALLVRPPAAKDPPRKFRSPQDWVFAAFRALGLPTGPSPDAANVLASAGQPLFGAPLPNGWPDTEAAWLGPETSVRRVDLAWTLAGHAATDADPVALAHLALGPALRRDTRSAVAHAGSRREAVALLLASPDFQRR